MHKCIRQSVTGNNKLTVKKKTTKHKVKLQKYAYLTHSYVIDKGPAPTCKRCECVLTVEHFLCTCTKYELGRKFILLWLSTFTLIISFCKT